MNQNVENELQYQHLLILAYFKANYKRYEFNEIIHIMGMTYKEMMEIIDYLLEKKYLISVKNYIVISRKGEDLLEIKGLDKFYEENTDASIKKSMNVDEIYIPIQFKL